jgi:hypothetical protein
MVLALVVDYERNSRTILLKGHPIRTPFAFYRIDAEQIDPVSDYLNRAEASGSIPGPEASQADYERRGR